jgi:hypothetical protein
MKGKEMSTSPGVQRLWQAVLPGGATRIKEHILKQCH